LKLDRLDLPGGTVEVTPNGQGQEEQRQRACVNQSLLKE
jgi:hypothetical protein